MQISIRASFPEEGKYNWAEALKKYESIGSVEVAFYLPQLFLEKVNADDVITPFKTLKIMAASIHMAHARIPEPFIFESVLKKTIEIAKRLNCNTIVAHPSFGKLDEVTAFIDNTISPLLEESKIYLCWETFSSKRRFLSGLEGIAGFCQQRNWHKACFDFSHIHTKQEEIIKGLSRYLDIIRVFHVSNRIVAQKLQHLPLFYKKADLDFNKILGFLKEKKFTGEIVLEYLPGYHGQLKKDAQLVIEKVNR